MKLPFTISFVTLAFGLAAQELPFPMQWNACSYTYSASGINDTSDCVQTNYSLVFEDDFSGTVLKSEYWQTSYPWGRSLHSQFNETGWERQYYDDKNVEVSGGMLHLKTIVDPGERSPDGASPPVFFRYSSGMVFSAANFSSGKFEARCKIPEMVGLFPAFWLYGFCSQEIDILEFTNPSETSVPSEDASRLIMTYHRQFDCATPTNGACNKGLTRQYNVDFSDDFHIFSVEWDKRSIVWKLDGEVAREVYRRWIVNPTDTGQVFGYGFPVKSGCEVHPGQRIAVAEPFPDSSYRMHIIFNTAVLMDRQRDAGQLPREFLIDYVKVFESKQVPAQTVHVVESELFPNPNNGTFYIPAWAADIGSNELKIADVCGREMMFTCARVGNNFEIRLSQKVPGIYIARTRNHNIARFYKFVVR